MIYNEVNTNEFARWVQASDTYGKNFSWNGANALQEYLEEMSEDTGQDLSFDPVAWCCEFSEYTNFDEFQHDTGYTKDGKTYKGYENINDLDELRDHTTVIEYDGGIIVQDF